MIIGDIKLTSRCQSGKNYQTPYGATHIDRHVYQSSKGGKIYVPLDTSARIIQGATPRFAKILSHKYSNLTAPSVIDDLSENHDRKIAQSYRQNVTDYVGSVVQAKEESWEYENPTLDKSVSTLGVSLDDVNILPSSNAMKEILDNQDSQPFQPISKDIIQRLQRSKQLIPFNLLPGLTICSMDATQYHTSETIHCDCCLTATMKNRLAITTRRFKRP